MDENDSDKALFSVKVEITRPGQTLSLYAESSIKSKDKDMKVLKRPPLLYSEKTHYQDVDKRIGYTPGNIKEFIQVQDTKDLEKELMLGHGARSHFDFVPCLLFRRLPRPHSRHRAVLYRRTPAPPLDVVFSLRWLSRSAAPRRSPNAQPLRRGRRARRTDHACALGGANGPSSADGAPPDPPAGRLALLRRPSGHRGIAADWLLGWRAVGPQSDARACGCEEGAITGGGGARIVLPLAACRRRRFRRRCHRFPRERLGRAGFAIQIWPRLGRTSDPMRTAGSGPDRGDRDSGPGRRRSLLNHAAEWEK